MITNSFLTGLKFSTRYSVGGSSFGEFVVNFHGL